MSILEEWVFNNLKHLGNCVISFEKYEQHGENKIKEECLLRGFEVDVVVNNGDEFKNVVLELKRLTPIMIKTPFKEKVVKDKGNKPSEPKPAKAPKVSESVVCVSVEESVSIVTTKEPMKTKLDMFLDMYGKMRTQLNLEELKAFSSIVIKDVEEAEETLNRINELPVAKVKEMVLRGAKQC